MNLNEIIEEIAEGKIKDADLSERRFFFSDRDGYSHSGYDLAQAIRNEKCLLRSLDLSCNQISDETIECFSKTLTTPHCPLRKLDLSSNEITNKGMRMLAEVVAHINFPLEEINLRGMEYVTNKGYELFFRSIQQNTDCTLRHVFGFKGNIEVLCKTLTLSHNNLLSIGLSGCEINDENIDTLLETLKHHNCKLEKFYLRNCEITNNVANAILKILVNTTTTLYSVTIEYTEGISKQLKTAIAQACELKSKHVAEALGVQISNAKHLKNYPKECVGLIASYLAVKPLKKENLLLGFLKDRQSHKTRQNTGMKRKRIVGTATASKFRI